MSDFSHVPQDSYLPPGQNDPKQQKRLFLAVAIVMGLTFFWQTFFMPSAPPETLTPDAGTEQSAATPPSGQGDVIAPDESEPSPPSAEIPERVVTFQTRAFDLAFSNVGGGISRAVLKNDEPGVWQNYKFEQVSGAKGAEPRSVDLALTKPGQSIPGASQVTGDIALPFDARYQVESRANGVTFRTQTREVALTKEFEFAETGYDLKARYSVTNRTQATKKAQLVVTYPAYYDPALVPEASFFAPPPDQIQAMALDDGSAERLEVRGASEEESFKGPVQFAGFDQRYFLGAVFPANGAMTQSRVATSPDGRYEAQIVFDLGALTPGQTVHRDVGFFMGPKSIDVLNRVSEAAMQGKLSAQLSTDGGSESALVAQNPELAESIDFGWWAVLCRALLFVLKFFESITHNWGVAIILLTVLVKLLLYPLSHKQMASMEAMRRIQPQIQELQKKYADDREKLGMEQMKLFQENKVNPFGGCLPLLVQMPVWFALYRTLYSSFELYREPLIVGWISDLTQPDPYYVLPLAMGVTMFITQKMQPQMGDARQAKMMLYFMPIFFTFIMLNLPAGLTLYIFTNNLLSIAQQAWLRRRFALADATAGSASAKASKDSHASKDKASKDKPSKGK